MKNSLTSLSSSVGLALLSLASVLAAAAADYAGAHDSFGDVLRAAEALRSGNIGGGAVRVRPDPRSGARRAFSSPRAARDEMERVLRERRREARARAKPIATEEEGGGGGDGRQQQGPHRGKFDRDLIYKGRPTGGNKYPFLVSIWVTAAETGNVQNATLLAPALCHGAMVSNDVFITEPGCGLTLESRPAVMVGDYDESAPLAESVQLREVEYVARMPLVTLALLTEPVTLPGFVPATMSGELQAPDAGSNLTFVGYTGDLLPTGTPGNLTADGWPGPALEANLEAASERVCGLATQASSYYVLCGLPREDDPAFPCGDDRGGPVLDGSNNLLGFTFATYCGSPSPYAVVLRSSYFKDAVEYTVCQMSRSDDLPFLCPDFICPVGTIQMGYPWVEMGDFTTYAKARNGFVPVATTQSPPPGAIARFDSTVDYVVTATDAANRTETCEAYVYIPPLSACGTVKLNVTERGSSARRAPFVPYTNRTIVVATVYKMRGSLADGLRGRGTATARLNKGGTKQNGAITFRGNTTKGALNNLRIEEPFTYYNLSNGLQVDFLVTDNTNPENNSARFDVYCQEALGA